jgi:biotin carboxyl carrier protein
VQYEVEVGGRRLQVVVTRSGDGFAVAIDGRTRHVDAARIDVHTLSLLVDARDGLKAVPYEHLLTNAASSNTRDGLKAVPYEHAPTNAASSNLAASSNVGDGLQAVPSGRAQSHEVSVAADPISGQLTVHLGATAVAVTLNGRRRWGRKDEGAATGSGPQRLMAPMPGKVVRVLVKPGDQVTPRQPVVVVEAMKMENELRANRGGTVAEILVREGMSVDAGALLVVIQ